MVKKLYAYALGGLMVVGGAALACWVDVTSGMVLGHAGAWLIGKVQKESLPRRPRHSTRNDKEITPVERPPL